VIVEPGFAFTSASNALLKETPEMLNLPVRVSRKSVLYYRSAGTGQSGFSVKRQTESTGIEVKNAFLFGCYTGLRISDLKTIAWWDIRHDQPLLNKLLGYIIPPR